MFIIDLKNSVMTLYPLTSTLQHVRKMENGTLDQAVQTSVKVSEQ